MSPNLLGINGLNPNYSPDSPFCRAISRDPNGFIVLDSSKAVFDYLWIADDSNMPASSCRNSPSAGAR